MQASMAQIYPKVLTPLIKSNYKWIMLFPFHCSIHGMLPSNVCPGLGIEHLLRASQVHVFQCESHI